MKAFALIVLALAALTVRARAHDVERTRVTLTFAEDGSFVLDIANDPNWLVLRLDSFARQLTPPHLSDADRDARIAARAPVMIDRVVLWVDGREIRPASAEYAAADATYRLRGRMPLDARALRWMYGAVGDAYPLIVRRADGRTVTEIIDGSNWSGTVDLSGQFKATRFAGVDYLVWLVVAFAAALTIRVALTLDSQRRRIKSA